MITMAASIKHLRETLESTHKSVPDDGAWAGFNKLGMREMVSSPKIQTSGNDVLGCVMALNSVFVYCTPEAADRQGMIAELATLGLEWGSNPNWPTHAIQELLDGWAEVA
jgi:hypothetical protein